MNEIRLGIYGGTFSPPHLGHVHAARRFLEGLSLDRLLVIPAGIPPHKDQQDGVTAEQRFAMCRLAFSALPRTEVSRMELDRAGISYTCDTLAALAAPGRRLFVLCGTDMMLTLDRWRQPERLFALATLVLVRRESDPELTHAIREKNRQYRARYGAEVEVLDGEVLTLSSAFVREQIRKGRPVSELLDVSVAAYIKEQRLYQ
ncbi:MAG: nicotinate-nucleotide adenylyltransferase [Eubacteriales bacterium]